MNILLGDILLIFIGQKVLGWVGGRSSREGVGQQLLSPWKGAGRTFNF